MRRQPAILPLLFLLAACASSPTALSSPPPSASANPTPGLASSGATPSPGNTSGQGNADQHGPPYGVLVDLLSDASHYTIALVAMDGAVVATRTAARRSPVANAGGHGLDMPYVSTTSTALYYLDGDGVVQSLVLDRLTTRPLPVTRLDVGLGKETAFAVSPDDKRIAVSVLDFNRTPVHALLYTDDLAGGARHVIYESDSNYVWPVAWHSGLLVLAHAYGPYLEDVARAAPGRDNPYWAISYHVVDPATGNRAILMGSCTPSGPLSPVGSACIQGGSIDWGGSTTPWSTQNWGTISAAASISPDGSFIAAAKPDDTRYVAFWKRDGTIATWVDGPGSPDWAGWLDPTHVLIASGTSTSFQPRIVTLTLGPSPARFIAANGFYAARLPTDID